MLILSRKPGQEIQIGDITITVKKVTANRVVLAIEAPPSVKIVRAELKAA